MAVLQTLVPKSATVVLATFDKGVSAIRVDCLSAGIGALGAVGINVPVLHGSDFVRVEKGASWTFQAVGDLITVVNARGIDDATALVNYGATDIKRR